MKAYNLSTRWRWFVSFMPWAKRFRYPHKKGGWGLDLCAQIILLPLSGI